MDKKYFCNGETCGVDPSCLAEGLPQCLACWRCEHGSKPYPYLPVPDGFWDIMYVPEDDAFGPHIRVQGARYG